MGVFGFGDGDEGELNIKSDACQTIKFLLKFCGRGRQAK